MGEIRNRYCYSNSLPQRIHVFSNRAHARIQHRGRFAMESKRIKKSCWDKQSSLTPKLASNIVITRNWFMLTLPQDHSIGRHYSCLQNKVPDISCMISHSKHVSFWAMELRSIPRACCPSSTFGNRMVLWTFFELAKASKYNVRSCASCL